MNRRRGARFTFRKPDFGPLFKALGRLRLPAFARLSRKNRRKVRLFSEQPDVAAHPTAHAHVATPPRSRAARIAHLLLGFLAFAAPLAAALAAFMVPLLGVRAYEYVMQSGYFHVREVLVDHATAPGLDRTTEPHLARQELLDIAGIGPGTHVLEADVDQMTARLAAHPWIRWARIERELPDTLVVHVVEHRPTAYLAARELYLVDELGVPFVVAPPDFSAHLPVISGIPSERLTEAKDAPEVERTLAVALNVLRLWEAQDLSRRYPIGELRLQPGGGVAVVLEGQAAGAATEVVIGRGPYREKLFRLEWVLEHLRSLGKTAEYVLLDLGDDADPRGIDIGGARVVVKADLGAEPAEPARAPAAAPPEAAPTPSPSPAIPAPPQAPDTPAEDVEAAPVSGGRPALDAGQE